MLGAADVTNGVRGRRRSGKERGWKGNNSDCISNRDFRGSHLKDLGKWKKRHTDCSRTDTEERMD